MNKTIKTALGKREFLNFSFFSIGKLISVFGSAIYMFAAGLYVLKITGSGLSFATTLVFGLIPIVIFSPIAGVMADRFDKKKIIVIADVANGVMFIALFVFSLSSELNIAAIYAGTFCTTALTTIFGVSMETAKPSMVSDEKLIEINSASKIIDSISAILGPVVGGLIFAFVDFQLFILINGISFIFSAVLEALIDFKFNSKSHTAIHEKVSFFSDIRQGLIFISKRKDIKTIIIVAVALNFFIGFSINVPLPFIINNVLKMGSANFGIIEGSFSVGIIIGALFVKKITAKIESQKLLISMGAVIGVCIIMLGIPVLTSVRFSNIVYLLYYLPFILATGVSISFIDIPLLQLLQTTVDEQYRGRVLSLIVSLAKVVSPAALILSGFLINLAQTWIIVFAGGALLIAVNAYLYQNNHKNTCSNIILTSKI